MMLKMDGENTLVSSAVNGEDIKVVRKFSADGLEIVSNIFTIYKYSLMNSKVYRNSFSLYHQWNQICI